VPVEEHLRELSSQWKKRCAVAACASALSAPSRTLRRRRSAARWVIRQPFQSVDDDTFVRMRVARRATPIGQLLTMCGSDRHARSAVIQAAPARAPRREVCLPAVSSIQPHQASYQLPMLREIPHRQASRRWVPTTGDPSPSGAPPHAWEGPSEDCRYAQPTRCHSAGGGRETRRFARFAAVARLERQPSPNRHQRVQIHAIDHNSVPRAASSDQV